MKTYILYRNIFKGDEFKIAGKYFNTTNSRMDITPSSLVIGRYSVLPFYKELENDLNKINSKLINSYQEHSYIANMSYVNDIEKYTPKTYYHPNDLKDNQAYIVKGATNSRKDQWKEKMFASNKKEAINIYLDLLHDPLLSQQGIVFREYIPLKNNGHSLNGMPWANEWRFFFYKDNLLTYNFYWSNAEKIPSKKELPKKAINFAKKIAKILSNNVNFFVIDIAETKTGKWIVIEVNDGQMSGLSENNPDDLYKNLKKYLK